MCLFMGVVNGKESVKLGFGYDRDFGIVGSIGRIRGFLGNEGVAIDKIVKSKSLDVDIEGSLYWYIGAGGYLNWNDSFGARFPVGLDWYFAQDLDTYLQLIPHMQIKEKAKFGLDSAIVIRFKF